MLYWLDTDLKGSRSVAEYLAAYADKTRWIKCHNWNIFDKAVREIVPKLQSGDTVVLDTLTSLLNMTQQNARLGTDTMSFDLWDKRAKYLEGDPNYLNVFRVAQDFTMQRLINISAANDMGKDVMLVVICHQTLVQEKKGELGKIIGPEVNPALIGQLVGRSSEIFQLVNIDRDIVGTDANGQPFVAVPHDTRILYLRRDDDQRLAKFNVSIQRSTGVPRFIVNPTLPKLYEVLGGRPTWLTLYGSPGVGKTTFAFSELWGANATPRVAGSLKPHEPALQNNT